MELLIKAFWMGIVEGLTEFLPISSTGHMILLERFLRMGEPYAQTFEVFIQTGAILAVLLYFRDILWPWSARNREDVPAGRDRSARGHAGGVPAFLNQPVWRIWCRAAVGVLPALVIGAVAGDAVRAYLFRPSVVAAALCIGGILLVVLERIPHRSHHDSVADFPYTLVLLIGLIQCLALVPGTSRSAATIIGALCLGASRRAAAEFSFYLAIPTLLAAAAYTLLKGGLACTPIQWAGLGVGFLVSFMVAWGVIAFLMNYIRTRSFAAFGWYRIVLGAGILLWMLHGGQGASQP